MKKFLLGLSVLALPSLLMAQRAMDGYSFSQPDLKGTARFMSMGGAFGALGGDLSSLSQNPAGIGVYRNNEIGVTVDLDAQQSKATSQHFSTTWDKTPFYLNNAGVVFTIRNSGALRNFNMGFTYNKSSSFNRRFRGAVPSLDNSITNYIAALANGQEVTVGDVTTTNTFDPYNPNDGKFQAPWATILGYDSRFITPREQDGKVHWDGQFGNGTTGSGHFRVVEKGCVDEYNIALGGNISNVFYWGMDFGIINFDYSSSSIWREELQNAYVANPQKVIEQTTSSFNLYNGYKVTGTGFNYKLGFIVKPIQELRLGFAFHTPTWYDLEQSYIGYVEANYGNHRSPINQFTNNGYDAVYDFKFRTPWRLIASVATVLANRFIISADYEWANYCGMHFSDKYEDDYWLSPDGDTYGYTNSDIKSYYRTVNTVRLGAEARLTRNISLRAGYSLSSAPTTHGVRDGKTPVYTDGARMDYSLDDVTYYITGGVGFHSKGFYTDLAYVYKNRKGKWYPYPVDTDFPTMGPSVDVHNANHQIVLSMGFKF